MPRRHQKLPRCSYVDSSNGHQCVGAGLGIPPFCRRHFEHILDDIEPALEDRDIAGVLEGLLDHPSLQAVLETLGGYIDRAAQRVPRARPGEGYFSQWPPPPRGQRRQAPPGQRDAPPPPPSPSAEDPRVVMGFSPGQPLTRAIVKKRRNELAGLFHPDRGGSDAAMQRVNAAADQLLAQLP